MVSLCAGRAWEAEREGSKSPSCCSLQHLELCHRFHTHLDSQPAARSACRKLCLHQQSHATPSKEHPAAPQLTADTPTDETSRSEEQGGREKRRERNKPGQR